jgi:MoaA/NifB/PqqE/SkfB family radical SAM enzyme
MDAKKLIKNKSICVIPWTGFELEPNGNVKNCIISTEPIGNINDTHIRDIVVGDINTGLKKQMLSDSKPKNCAGCYLQEKHRNSLDSISSRLYYLKEVGTKTDMKIYDSPENFSLKHVDVRWTNSCNQACVYCGPHYSSKWGLELQDIRKSKAQAREEVKDFVFEHVDELENVYLAGGEPMLMKENFEFLKLLHDRNPGCTVRVNTNLSKTNTGVFDLLCDFPNVHWTLSIETIEEEYEYIRYHGKWQDFMSNLGEIRKLDHKISFNMLHFILNYRSLFDCVDFFKRHGFHDNTFVAGPLYAPDFFNLLNLPDPMLQDVISKLKHELNKDHVGYLKNSYENLLAYFTSTPWTKDIAKFITQTDIRDRRRNLECKKIFPKLYEELERYGSI